jgi:hypothetical protein
VWSRKPRKPVANPETGLMEGIVSTLLSPLHTRAKDGNADTVTILE